MDLTTLSIGVIVVIIVVAIVIYFISPNRRPGAVPVAEQAFRFSPGTPGGANVTRTVTIHARPQLLTGRMHTLDVVADPIPSDVPTKPPTGKGIDRLVRLVIEPHVRAKETRQDVFEFNPPLKVVIDFTEEDSKDAPRDPKTGQPMISILTLYKDPKGEWRWERLKTTVTCNATCDTGQLSAEVTTLHPGDPFAEGNP